MSKQVRSKKPCVTAVTIKRTPDYAADTSFLGEYVDNIEPINQTSGMIIIDRKKRGDWKDYSNDYRYFIAANVDNMKNALENYRRMEAYNKGEWSLQGLEAVATIDVPDDRVISDGRQSHLIQYITSGGIGGIESDCPDDDLKEVEDEQLEELRQQLKAFGLSIPKGMKIKRENF